MLSFFAARGSEKGRSGVELSENMGKCIEMH